MKTTYKIIISIVLISLSIVLIILGKQYEIKQVVLAGGVSANSYLRSEMVKECEKLNAHIIIPPMWCCTDNAAMIAKVAEHLYDMKVFAGLDLGVDPNWSIEKWNEFEN